MRVPACKPEPLDGLAAGGSKARLAPTHSRERIHLTRFSGRRSPRRRRRRLPDRFASTGSTLCCHHQRAGPAQGWIERSSSSIVCEDPITANTKDVPPATRLLPSALLLLTALAFMGKWGILLFAALPENIGVFANAISLLRHVFVEDENAWFFYLMALAPLLFVWLAIQQYLASSHTKPLTISFWLLLFVGTLICLLVLWPAAIFAAMGGHTARTQSAA